MKPGDPITYWHKEWQVALHGEVMHTYLKMFDWMPSGRFELIATFDTPLGTSLEGIRWCHGHHKMDSPDVLAMRAATALIGVV